MVELTPGYAGLCAGRAVPGIDADTLHARKVDDQSTVAHRIAADIVAATANSYEQTVRLSKIDAVNHVGNSGAVDNQCRALVDHAVPDLAGVVIARVARTQQFTEQAGFEIFDVTWRSHGDLLRDVIGDSVHPFPRKGSRGENVPFR